MDLLEGEERREGREKPTKARGRRDSLTTVRESILRSNRRDSKVFPCSSSSPRLLPSEASFCRWRLDRYRCHDLPCPTPGCGIALVGDRIAANVHRRAKRLISPEIHAAIPDNGVENFITPARDSAIEKKKE